MPCGSTAFSVSHVISFDLVRGHVDVPRRDSARGLFPHLRLWEVARSLFPADRHSAETWAEARYEELKAWALDGVLVTLRAHADQCEEAAKAAHYIATNRERMR